MRIVSAVDNIYVSAQKTVSWEDISRYHPGLYGPEEGYDDEEDDDPHGMGWAANHLAFDRPEDPNAEGSSVWELNFHPERVDPKHIDYARHGHGDPRVLRAEQGYKTNSESVPPLLLVHRHGVYQVADGHHRAEAAHRTGNKVRAYVAYSPHENEPFSDEENPRAPFHGAEPSGKGNA